jgi:hypothetical protein
MTNFTGINAYEKFPNLQAREEKNTQDLTNLWNELGYYRGQDFDTERYWDDYWFGQDEPTGVFQKQNALLTNYYNDLNTMGVKGTDGQPLALHSNNLPEFQGVWWTDKDGKDVYGTPDEHTFDWQGPSYVMGQLQTTHPVASGDTDYAPQAPYFNRETGKSSFTYTPGSTPTFSGGTSMHSLTSPTNSTSNGMTNANVGLAAAQSGNTGLTATQSGQLLPSSNQNTGLLPTNNQTSTNSSTNNLPNGTNLTLG